jgi:hypothetical protein
MRTIKNTHVQYQYEPVFSRVPDYMYIYIYLYNTSLLEVRGL